ncbi:hypothetical protein [Methylobacterium brachythecii]|uniref:Uncharacterized protein n=1 Tax=Methylobacterium brachythecii TaxID=1176177 RepID=A0A7W6AHQ6_9HYPH|nr:hypothetical protein [Methylobacterium brachythecii]MBB3903563.1 hypothetical protein [Methylobacterium brachythecii]GLS44085.1 hypothetical protein GCM10007884_20720 [Methylobacterium brachythecii]
MKPSLDPTAGATVTGLFLGSLALAAAVALVTAPITPRSAVARDNAATARLTVPAAPLVAQASVVQSQSRRFSND